MSYKPSIMVLPKTKSWGFSFFIVKLCSIYFIKYILIYCQVFIMEYVLLNIYYEIFIIWLVGRVFANTPGHLSSIPGRVIPKT